LRFKEGDKVKWTDEAVRNVNVRDMYDAFYVTSTKRGVVVGWNEDQSVVTVDWGRGGGVVPCNGHSIEVIS
jgi:hypothetical protein